MISLVLATFLSLPSLDAGWPEPYFGFAFQTYSESSFLGFDGEGGTVERKLRRKYLNLGLPFQVAKLNWGDAKNLRALVIPEVGFNDNMIHLNVGLGLEQMIPFGNYRSIPAGIFWAFSAGLHYGFILDKRDYVINSNIDPDTETVSTKQLTILDRSSIAGHFRLAFGPEFYLNSSLDMRLRFFIDALLGKVGMNQARTGFSDNVGSLFGFQIQFAFK